jgi:preprotein translocase subunit SecG
MASLDEAFGNLDFSTGPDTGSMNGALKLMMVIAFAFFIILLLLNLLIAVMTEA